MGRKTTKICELCGRKLLVVNFSNDTTTKDGYNRLCRDCTHKLKNDEMLIKFNEGVPEDIKMQDTLNVDAQTKHNGLTYEEAVEKIYADCAGFKSPGERAVNLDYNIRLCLGKCGKVKDLSEFAIDSLDKHSGRRRVCKECNRETNRNHSPMNHKPTKNGEDVWVDPKIKLTPEKYAKELEKAKSKILKECEGFQSPGDRAINWEFRMRMCLDPEHVGDKVLPFEAFVKNCGSRTGRSSRCRVCEKRTRDRAQNSEQTPTPRVVELKTATPVTPEPKPKTKKKPESPPDMDTPTKTEKIVWLDDIGESESNPKYKLGIFRRVKTFLFGGVE